MNISPARTAAFDILLRIETKEAFSSALLPIYEGELSISDRGLCHEITLGTLRRQIYLDRLIDTLAGGKKIDIQVRIAIRMALYQIKYLDKIPEYSAIDESVNLVRRAKKTSAKGFVNAILRRSVRESIILEYRDEIDKISVETSHPRWLIEKWTASLGQNTAKEVAEANNERPVTAFRVLKDNRETEEIVASAQASTFADGCFLLESFDPRLLGLVESGEIYIQDEASQIAANTVKVPTNGRFLDVCAAPGGKTGMVARKFQSNSKLLIAGDIHWQRVLHLRENCIRQGSDSVGMCQYDAALQLPFAEQSFDAVLVDAPCSGTGTIRHNPELRYLLSADDIDELPRKQLSILSNASKLVKSGGSVVYSTCSLEREENEQVCSAFMRYNEDFDLIEPNVPKRILTDDGFARTWPHRDGMDGFFIAQFRRK